jgi:phosphomannomutase/phosphoglucomutase
MAANYHACRTCPQRDDGALPDADSSLPGTDSLRFTTEGIEGTHLRGMDAPAARRIGIALGTLLKRAALAAQPSVVIGSDGRPLTVELTAAVGEGLRMAGCDVIDVGFATAPCVVFAVSHLDATGGLLIGNANGLPLDVGFKFWSAKGQPLSAGGQLDALQRLLESGVDRPTRRGGTSRRFRADVPYLACLAKYFHALRPLRFVLDTPSEPLRRQLIFLASAVACEITLLGRRELKATDGEFPATDHIATAVREKHAHFGIWIDGDGERCQVIDERGQSIAPERTALLLLGHFLDDRPQASFALEQTSHDWISQHLQARGGSVHLTPPSRESIYAACQTNAAIAGGGPSGRTWFGQTPPTADALQALAVLLTILSQSDRHLSERIADLCP